jgi:hypothetical protein
MTRDPIANHRPKYIERDCIPQVGKVKLFPRVLTPLRAVWNWSISITKYPVMGFFPSPIGERQAVQE